MEDTHNHSENPAAAGRSLHRHVALFRPHPDGVWCTARPCDRHAGCGGKSDALQGRWRPARSWRACRTVAVDPPLQPYARACRRHRCAALRQAHHAGGREKSRRRPAPDPPRRRKYALGLFRWNHERHQHRTEPHQPRFRRKDLVFSADQRRGFVSDEQCPVPGRQPHPPRRAFGHHHGDRNPARRSLVDGSRSPHPQECIAPPRLDAARSPGGGGGGRPLRHRQHRARDPAWCRHRVRDVHCAHEPLEYSPAI
jgi:hypothetical protein